MICCAHKRFVELMFVFGLLSVLSASILGQSKTPLRATYAAAIGSAHISDTTIIKCGTPLLNTIRLSQLTQQQRTAGILWYARAVMQRDKVSPSGKFRIHYDTSGINTPAMLDATFQRVENTYGEYTDSVAAIFDAVWIHHIVELGYDPPPSDGNHGGGPEYDIYIDARVEGDNIYGLTDWEGETVISDGLRDRMPTYIFIDNDYTVKYPTRGLNAVRVTAAHEFFHAIQLGSYGAWKPDVASAGYQDFYFYEVSSTWMEDATYPRINDYLFYLTDFFHGFRDYLNRSYSFTYPDGGYERAHWGIFLTKRFGTSVMRSIWEGIRSSTVFPSMKNSIIQQGSTIEDEYATFSIWNYFTGPRADTINYFPEGNKFPTWSANFSARYSGSLTSVSDMANQLSTNFIEFCIGTDTLTIIVSNLDVQAAEQNISRMASFKFQLTPTQPSMAYQLLPGGIYLGSSLSTAVQWKSTAISDNMHQDHGNPSPNPLVLAKHSSLQLPVYSDIDNRADVSIYSMAQELVYSETIFVSRTVKGKMVILPTQDLRKSLSSGVYIVIVQQIDSEKTWKIAVIK
jgi:hypothetical protein